MNRFIVSSLLLFIGFTGFAQKKKTPAPVALTIPMTADHWLVQPQKAEFLEYKSVPAMKILEKNAPAIVKDLDFSNGTIEYDIEPQNTIFSGIYFRRKDSADCEYFYLRMGYSGKPQAIDGVQYAPIVKGVLLWNMLDYYQGPAAFKKDEWNHVKLVISGAQMLVYVNDMVRPALEIPRLEGDSKTGSLAFDGVGVIANLVVKPDVTEGLSPLEGFDPTHQDNRYIRNWTMSEPAPLPPGQELFMKDLPKTEEGWIKIQAERRGLVNCSRQFGRSKSRRVVWLKARLKVASDQVRQVKFGFTDEAWVFINGQLNFADKNLYIAPIRKTPDGRCDLDNASFSLPLKAGMNELLIGVSNDFYGWGIIARLDTMDGVELVQD